MHRLILILGAAPLLLRAQTSATVALQSSPNSSVFGAPVTLTATVTPSSSSGGVTFYDGVAILGVSQLSNGQATLTTRLLNAGAHTLRVQPFYHLELPDDVADGPLRSGADGMAFDDQGDLFVATKMGIQICDQAGRVAGIIRKPSSSDVSNLVFGGADLKTLYVTAGGKVYKRQMRRKGMFPWLSVKLPRPVL